MTRVKNNDLSVYNGKRKHGSQIKSFEEKIIWKRLKEIVKWNISGHALDRLEEKNINATYEDIVSTIHNAVIIEYRIVENKVHGGYEERVVLRSKATVNRKYNLNVVYSLTNKRIITVWINNVNDSHKTLDWSIYSEDMKVFGA